jgi:hypothetical protein
LWDAVIREIDYARRYYMIFQVYVRMLGGDLPEARRMISPALIWPPRDRRITQLQDNVFKVWTKCFPRQSLHILYKYSLWECRAHSPKRFREHIAAVMLAGVLASDGEWLTWGTTSKQVNLSGPARVMVLSRVNLAHWPVAAF